MKINVNTGKRTLKMRILSAFMAFLIFSLAFTNLIGQLGIMVKADDTLGHIHNNTTNKVSQYKNNMNTNKGSTGSAYTYTGKYTNDNTITMFDYVSDYELSGTYNNCQQDESGYTDVYHALNNAISNGTLISASSSNVTIEFQAQYRTASEAPKVQVNYYDSSNYGSGFQNMKLVSKSSSKENNTTYNHFIYRFTVARNQTIGNMTLSSHSITGLSFKINDGSDLKNHNTGNQNYSINSNDCAGKKYVFHHYNNGSDTGDYFPDNTTGTADAIYSSDYSIPFYFGNFWLGNEATAYGDDIKPVYNNFYWRANMGLKPYNTRGSASTQKLVGNNLSGPDDKDAKGNLLDVNHCTYNATPALNNEVELPYFSKTWAENNKTSDNKPLIRYYDEDVVGGNITFPFYEVYKEHNSTGRYERYYQFDSREANLKFNIQNTNDINNHKGYFSESDTDIVRHWWDGGNFINYTKDDRSNVGFFPFNENNSGESENTNAHNLGFGMKMEMDFQLEADGCVKVMNKDSNDKLTDIEGDGVQRVPTIFEFTGDDDLWVFIDGNLVLDMGGDHFKSHGKIDFYNKTATVDSAIDFGTENARDDLGANPTAAYVNSSSSPTFLSLLSGHNFDSTNPGKYDTTTTHTLTVFYMERGMMDSNLLIRFNYSPIPNNSRMKIAEVTKFDDVNEGLKPATKRAAEGDVFKYTVTNTLPSNILPAEIENPLSSGAKYPELGAYTRTAEGNSSWTTTLTPNGTGTAEDKLFVNGDPGNETYVKDTAYWWVDGFSNGSWLVGKTTPQSGSDNGGDLWLMYGTADILYGDSKRGVESSAEFEKQFTRNSTMKVVQGTNLYRLPDRDANGHTTLFNDSGQLQAVEQTGTGSTQSRTVSNYYSTNYRLIDRNNNDLTTINDLNNTKTFSFNNDASVGDSFAVMLTEFVENTVKVGAITIKKQKPTEDTIIPSDKEFAVKVRFEDVFGIEGVNADSAAEYGSIKYSVYDSSGVVTEKTNLNMAAGKVTVGGVQKDCGIISLKVGEWAAISGIPVDTKYIIYEEEPKYAPTYVNNNSNVSVGTINTTGDSPNYLSNVSNNNATVTNFSHSLTIKEVTDFSTVNSGLLTYTKKAAENDVFKYTVKNDSNVDAINSGIATPTYDTYERQANGATTAVKLSGQDVQYVQVDDTEHVYLDISKFTSWNNYNPVFAAWLWDNGSEGFAKEFEKVSEYLYRIYPENKNNMIILRLNPNIKTQHPNDWLFHVWENRTDDTTKPYEWNRIGGENGITATNGTYKVTDWSAVDYTIGPVQIPTSEVIYNYNNYIYDSSDSNHYVKNVNYEWVDEFAAKTSGTANDLLAGTTDNTGSFYLMHGETNATNGGSGDHESSANFYNQFARGSTMTVVQSGTLYSPDSSAPANLGSDNARGTSDNTLSKYYTTTKTLAGSTDSAPNNDTFTYNNGNNNKSIKITEIFKNTVNVGAISIEKELVNPSEPKENFQFKLTLTNVLGQTGNDVTDYSGIKSRLDTGSTQGLITTDNISNVNGENAGTVTLQPGQKLTIYGIPVGTSYSITETETTNYKQKTATNVSGTVEQGSLTGSNTTYEAGNYTPVSANAAVFTNERRVGDLTLTKALVGEENADTLPTNETPYTLKVTLKAPTGVNLNNYFANNTPTITTSGTPTGVISAVTTHSNDTYEFNVTVYPKDGSHNNTVTVKNIPYGTTYSVTEVYYNGSTYVDIANDPNHEYTYTINNNGTYGSEIRSDSAVVNVTNVYRKVTMTKKDNKDTSKTLSGATYVLVRLKDAALSNGELVQGAIDAFNTANANAFSNPLSAPLSTYVDGYSSTLTTGTYDGTSHDDGKVVVNDSMMTDGLKPGKYFFVELSPPSDYYDNNNNSSINYNNGGTTAAQNKVFEIADTIPSNLTETRTEINYYDERKLCALIIQEDVLQSTVDACAASANQDFAVLVTLDGTDPNVDIDPRAFFTDSDLTGMGVTAASIDRTQNKKLSFYLPVSKSGGQKNILGLPLGVSYDVSQTLPDISATLPNSRWINISDNGKLNSNITSESPSVTFSPPVTTVAVTYPTETARITNAMVGSLILSKALANGTTNTENKKFDFNVSMTIPNDVTYYSFERAVGTGAASAFSSYTTSGSSVSFTEAMSDGTSNNVTISGIPYGTTYSVEETEPGGDWGIINQVNTTNNKINDTTTTTTITNGKVGKLNLNKIIAGEYKKNGVNVGDDFEFEVTLTNTVNSLSNVKVDGVAQTVTSGDSFSVNVTSIKTGDAAKTVVISNIPHGTQYTVIEASSSRPPTGGTVTDEVGTAATLNNDVTVTITNTYPMPDPITVTINMTKIDSETGTAITNSDETKRAKYRLLKLTETFETAYENDPTSVSNTFKNSTAYNDSTLASYKLSDSAETTVNADGTISFSGTYVPGGDVYPGDIFFFYEVQAPDGYKKDNSVSDGKLITIVKGTTSYSVRYTDEPESMDVNLLKTDDSNNPLAGAQFDLYFKESYNPPTNSINESEISPKLLPSKSINSTNTEPTPPAVSNSETISSTRYSYTAAEAPDASESTWILPRTDNDYIYFRDYNISSSQYSGDDNGRWINTWFNTNEFGQSKEIFYDHRYWLKAVFTASGKETREYSVWERFVDHYDGQETVVWKIQPPDGYEYVEFILCDGANNNNHVRNTEKFKYVLGNIYTKTNKGKYDNGQYGYPVKGEHWSTYWDSAKHSSDPPDHRITYSTSTPNTKQYVFGQSSKDGGSPSTLGSMAQADRYIATPQKLVFHCNSKVVWHNIHIEFFDKNQQPIGQEFPGYMMEPYAYAGNDYRINGYLTYELTIPKDAKYFRVNDGITMDTTYGYYSRITEIYSGDTNKYYKIDGSYTNSNQKNIKLVQSTSFATNSGKKYTNQNEIESDYDYIYFATPKTGGWDKVYAHFYGGGDLQADNWQRACYSIWPGLAPVGTEYKADENGTKNVEHHSDIYGYTTNPDSTFEWKDGNTTYTVYKFRIPLGDRTNYKKVIFNNGLSKSSGGKLTSPIEYSAGYIYKKSGSPTKHYEEKNTYTYTGRGDELYVKMNNSTLEKWDDLHITFYDSGKNQILQGKDGYVMKYSGTDTSGNTYFSMLIPSNAAYFSLNNGIGKSDPHNLSLSGKYEILPLNASGDENTSQNFTKGNMVYTLNDSTLSKTLPEFTEDTSSSEVTLDAYPSPRGDYIYIKDVGGNTLISPPPTFKFYNSSGSELTSPGVNTHAAYGSDKWYSVGIPTDAVKFSMNDGSTKYDIYQKTTETTTSDLNMNFTPGNMYYSATGNQTLSLIWPTFSNTSEATNYNDDNWSNTKRSDALYLVCADKSDWNGMTVTFYDAGGTAIKNSSNVSNIRANYVGELVSGNPAVSGQSTTNEDAVGHWFKVKIPDNAKTFVAKAGDSKETVSGDIYEYRTKTARYRTDYTLGDMQYRISNTGTGSSPTVHTLTRFYPIFTQDAVYTMPDNDDVSSTSGSTLVDESQVLDSYVDNSPAAPTTTSGTSDEPVLHATASNTITYTWQEGGSSSGGTLYYDNSSTLWSTVYVHLWGGTNSTEWTGKKMNDEGNNIWSFALTGTDGSGSYDYSDSKCCIFNANSNDDKTLNLKLPNDISSKNYLYGSTKVWGTGSYVYFKQPDGAFSNNSSQSWRDLKVEFTDSNNNTETLSDIIKYVGSSNLQIVGQTSTISSYWKIFVDPTKNWRKIKFIRASDTSTTTVTVDLFDYGSGYGVGNYFTLSTYKQGEENSLNSVQQVKEKDRQFSEYAATVTYSSQFQPEDRYGYIQNAANQFDTNGTTATTNNFVKVVNDVSGLTDLHIKFFNNSDGADSHRVDTVDSTVTGSVISPYGIKLKPDTVFTTYPAIDSTQYTPATGPYYVRLPKNAKYAQLYNGSTAVGSMVDLADSSGKTGGITLTISGDSSSQTVSKSYVSRGDTGIQVNAKKTDMDYIYFTDENGTMSGIRAYYFGDADGEYCAWPGVAPSYSYTDSNGKTVYAFQYPTREGSTGKAYPYVIFNSGGTYPSSTMTIALNYSGSGNYSISTDTTRYGTNDSTAINAKHTNVTPKTDNPTVNYSTNNKYIFFVNNGTYNFSQLSDTRYTLDDVHIEFFDMNKTPLQTTAPGYVMDKIGTYSKDSTSGDLYRIAIPSNAQYFRINNGTGKGSGTTKYNVRNSVIEEIAANGIYKFVDESNATADVWDGSAPSSAADLDDHNYKLKLINEKQPDPEDDDIIEPRNYEVRLARVETKNSANSDNGNISKIIWLKPAVGYEEENPQTTFDSEYLDYEGIDIAAFLASNNDAAVKVKKRGTYYWKETKVPTGYKIPDGESDEKIFIIEDRSHPIANIGTVTFINEKLPEPTNKVILTKTAKEKVGDNDVGATLTGAKFLLYVNDGDSNDSNDTLAGTFNQAKDASNNNISGEYTYVSSGGAFNTNASDSTKYMETGNVISDTDHYGKLTLNGLPVGDYYLKEMTAPTGYSEIDSNTGTNKRVYFSIGDNTVEKELVCADEMAPAYIRLFEHVNDLMIDEWGHPTFVFKITNTTTNKTNLVSLTFDGTTLTEEKIAATVKWYNNGTAVNYGAGNDPIDDSKYADWYVEGTTESEYKGVYHIDSQGRIKVEPGTYSITRVPVSRYEFVTSGNLVYTTDTEPTETYTVNSSGTETAETVTLTAGKTADVHYYDKVGYYDKFSHVDEQINKFYKLENGANKTIKGIRIKDYHQVGTTGTEADTNDSDTMTVSVEKLTIYKIMSDGSEAAMTSEEKAALTNFNITYTYDSATGDKREFGGKAATEGDPAIPAQFSYANNTITVIDASDFENGVYTLNADYKGFTAKFDLVFSRT